MRRSGVRKDPVEKNDKVMDYLENSLTLTIPHVELPNLDLGGLLDFRTFDSTFEFQWDHPP
jgi:hypothetical protein